MLRRWLSNAAFALALYGLIASCGGSEDEQEGSGDLTITALLRHDDNFNPIIDKRIEEYKAWVEIMRGDEPVKDAKVVVEGFELVYQPNILEEYIGELPGRPFVPRQDITIEITIGDTKVTDKVRMPGGITISEDGAMVSWQHEGNSDHMFVQPVDEDGRPGFETTYATYEGKNCEKVGDLVSPYSVGAAAYPEPGEYLLSMFVREIKRNAFSGMPGLKSGSIEAVDLRSEPIGK